MSTHDWKVLILCAWALLAVVLPLGWGVLKLAREEGWI
jgi:hypothetical protein